MNTTFLKGRKIFLVDAIGAIVSVFSLLIPYSFEDFFGMPKSTVSIFICIAIVCAVYSTIVYVSKTENWKRYLTVIAFFNIAYCFFTFFHVFKNWETMTVFGYLYFLIEILIIMALAIFELRLSANKSIY